MKNNKAVSLAKLLLIVHGLVTVGYAGTLLFNPANVAEYMGLMIATPDGRTELITMYVGMSGTMAFFMLYGAFNRNWLHQATLFLFLSMSGIAIGRAFGFVFFETSSYTLNALYYDIPVALLSWVAYLQLQKTATV